MKDEKKFKGMMYALCSKYEKDADPVFTEMVWNILKPFSDDECSAAFSHVLKYGRYWKDLLPDMMEKFEGGKHLEIENINLQIKAEDQAGMVLKILGDRGADSNPKFDDSITSHIMTNIFNFRTWGRQHLSKNSVFFRRDFVEIYMNYTKGGEVRQLTHDESKQLLARIGQ